MKRKYIFTAIVTLFAAFLLTLNVETGAKASQFFAGSPSLNVDRIYNNSKAISGTASKGVKVYARLNNQKWLGSTQASKTNGKFTIKLSQKLTRKGQVFVYAQRGRIKPYEVIRIQTPAAKAKTNVKTPAAKKVTTKKNPVKKARNNSKHVNLIKAYNIDGQWVSNATNGYSQLWIFNNNTGLNIKLYKNKVFQKDLVKNATYDLRAVNKRSLYRVIFRGKGQKRNTTLYIHLTSKKHFNIADRTARNAAYLVYGSKESVYAFNKR